MPPPSKTLLAMSKVFISYRRDDSAAEAGRIYDRLVTTYSADDIFKDVDSIPLGSDFRDVISKAVGRCQVLLAVIGRDWLSITSPSGGRRLDDPGDFVRLEIEAALQRGIPVIPVLVSGAAMPAGDQLPSTLQALVYRNGIEVRRDPDFHHDVARLMRSLDRFLPSPARHEAAAEPLLAVESHKVTPSQGERSSGRLIEPPGGDRRRLFWAAGGAFVVLIAVGLIIWSVSSAGRGTPGTGMEPSSSRVPADTVDPDPFIAVKFHDWPENVTLAAGGNVKLSEGSKTAEAIPAFWEPSRRFGLVLTKDFVRGEPKRLTFDPTGRTNNTVIRLDDQNNREGWIWGESPYRRKDNGKDEGPGQHGRWKEGERVVRLPPDPNKGEGHKSVWVYPDEKVTVTQFVEIVPSKNSRRLDTCLVRYVIENNDSRDHRVGLRFMLHTYIGTNPGVPFIIPGLPGLCDSTAEFHSADDVPDFIQALERPDLRNPGTVAMVQFRLSDQIEVPGRVTLGAWPNLDLQKPPHNLRRCLQEKTLWDVPVLPFGTLKPGDSCVTMYWNQRRLEPGKKREVGFAYGLGLVQ
jgi:hypothetical protein